MHESGRYFSLRGQQSESSEPDLQLHVRHNGKDTLEIDLRNRHFDLKKRKYKLRFFWLCSIYGIYASCIMLKSYPSLKDGHIICSIGVFVAISLQIVKATLNLVRSERVTYLQSHALQIETVRTFSRSTYFILPINNIHDLTLNEVIEDLDIRYILIVRTKGDLFDKYPIVPLFQHLNPSVDCSRYILKVMNQFLLQISK